MATDRSRRWSRREALGASAALAGLVVVGRGGDAGAQAGAVGGGGVAGGGIAETADGGEAEFVLFATRMQLDGDDEGTVFGTVRWVDPNWESRGVDLTSTEVTAYGPPGGDPESRERVLSGRMSDGEDEYPFVLRVELSEGEDLGGDTIFLTVGPRAAGTPEAGEEATPAGELDYEVEATVTAGDVRLLSFEEPNTA